MGAHRLLAECVEEAVFITEPGGRMLYANASLQRLTGYTVDDLRGADDEHPFIHRDDAARVADFIAAFLESGAAVSEPIESRFVDRWGQTRWYRSVLGRVRFDDTDAVQFVTRQTDRDDGSSPSSELIRDYRLLVQHAGDGIAKLDARGRFLFSNPRFREIVGRDALALEQAAVADVLHADAGRDAARFLVPGRFETELVSGAGEKVHVEVVVVALAPGNDVMALVRDVTEQRRLQRELHRREKLQSLGLLAGGVAHDLSSFLTVVQTNGALAEVAERDGRSVTSFLREIRQACEKAAGLCARLLASAGQAPVSRSRIDLRATVEEIVSLLQPSLPPTVSVLWTPGPHVHVCGDAAALQPLVMNLITNASDAIGLRSGHVLIEVGTTEHTAEAVARLEPGGDLPPGPAAFIRVTDDGAGMDEHTRARMFDPFFTTKSAGHGLGLPSVLGTVRAHSGAICVQSATGAGTTMTIYLPEAPPESLVAAAPIDAHEPGRLVLIADDEPSLVRSLTLMLASAGFETIEARDGAQAVALVERRTDIAAALLDASMPVMGGAEAAQKIRALRAGLPIVMMSGYKQAVPAGVEVITKPFEPERLLTILGRVTARP
ncbi:MAG: PAS domain S-box protein [Labilithrix sp.]|nr:PAS domain S-box protein [Labilithrix sp.]